MSNDWAELSESQRWVDEPGLSIEDEDSSSYISASQIKTYRTCPKQYWFKYRSDKEPTKAEKGYLALGSAVHKAIELVMEDDPLFRQNKLTHELKKTYKSLDSAQRVREIDKGMFSDGLEYLETAARYLSQNSDVNIRDIESKVEYSLARPDIDCRVKAIMDVATEDEIWDWKTGRVRDDTPTEEKIQGAVYMKAFEHKYGRPPSSIRFVYLKEETERRIEPSDETWNEMLTHARNLVRGRKKKRFQADPGDICYFCSWEYHCDASPAGVGNINWEAF